MAAGEASRWTRHRFPAKGHDREHPPTLEGLAAAESTQAHQDFTGPGTRSEDGCPLADRPRKQPRGRGPRRAGINDESARSRKATDSHADGDDPTADQMGTVAGPHSHHLTQSTVPIRVRRSRGA